MLAFCVNVQTGNSYGCVAFSLTSPILTGRSQLSKVHLEHGSGDDI